MTAQEIKIRIEGLKQQLVAKYHPEKVILFGSAVPATKTALPCPCCRTGWKSR